MKHTTQIFSPSSLHFFDCARHSLLATAGLSLFSSSFTDFSTHRTPLYSSRVNFSGPRLCAIPILLCLFLTTGVYGNTPAQDQAESSGQTQTREPVPQPAQERARALASESTPDKSEIADQTDTKTITRAVTYKPIPQESEPAKPIITSHVADRVADRVTEMVNSVINIARDPRNPHNLAFNITNALANIVHIVLLAKENKSLRSKLDSEDTAKIDLEIEQAIRAYLENLDPQIQSGIASLIIKRLAID